MFNLEQAVAEWRRKMVASGIKTPVLLVELESHLREEIDRQVQSGVTMQPAFEAAVQLMGPANALKTEFRKLGDETEWKQTKRIVTILGGLFGILFGFAMVWPQLGMLHRTGAIPHIQPLLLGAAIVIAAGSVTIFNIRRNKGSRGRKLIGICLIVVGGFCSTVNASTLFELNATERLWWPPVVATIFLFFGSCLYLHRKQRWGPIPTS